MSNEVKENLPVGLYFFVDDKIAFAGCLLDEAESYGDFLIYPKSHYEIWDGFTTLNRNGEIPYDYYPRGRIVYRKTDDKFIIYYDKCIADKLHEVFMDYENCNVMYEPDEHYCCHKCNPDYAM